MAIDVKEQVVKLSKDIQHDIPMLVDWHHNDNNSTISSCLLECRALVGQSCSKVEQQQTPGWFPPRNRHSKSWMTILNWS
uniref:Uncharacterized protein n=1 Tax=Romanomermis culicivorax TaxID=13658 RepID=A0A915KJ88_ROMCU